MQDRLKFKVYHKPTNKIYNVYGFNDDFVFIDTLDTCEPLKTEDCILLQCTGLKDKNDKLIYEGDIVKETDLYERKKLVKWLDCSCGFNISTTYNYNDGKCGIGGYVELEVISNIYENPDLLENKDE